MRHYLKDAIEVIRYYLREGTFVELEYEDVLNQVSEIAKEQIAWGLDINGRLPALDGSGTNHYEFDNKSVPDTVEHIKEYFLPKKGQLFEAMDVFDVISGEERHVINMSVKDIVAKCGDDRVTKEKPHTFPHCRIRYGLKK